MSQQRERWNSCIALEADSKRLTAEIVTGPLDELLVLPAQFAFAAPGARVHAEFVLCTA